MDGPGLRRSTRSRKQNQRYSESHLDDVSYSGSEASAYEGDKSLKGKRQTGKAVANRDDGFESHDGFGDAVAVGVGAGDGSASTDDIRGDTSSEVDEKKSRNDKVDAMDIDASNGDLAKSGTKRKRAAGKAKAKTQELHSKAKGKKSEEVKRKTQSSSVSSAVRNRGVNTFHRHGSKAQKMMCMFGSDPVDIEAAKSVRDKWAGEPCLPSRLPDEATGSGGMSYSAHYTSAMRLEEMERAWGWYLEGKGREAFSREQNLKSLTGHDMSKYTTTHEQFDYTFLVGPPKHMRPVSIQKGQAISVRETICNAHGDTNGSTIDDERADDAAAGWYIYVGDRINCLEWTPNRQETTQYLAVSTLDNDQLSGRRSKVNDAGGIENEKASFAFIPTAPSPAAIYIWAFEGLEHVDDASKYTIIEQKAPMLEVVLCTDWGPVKQFKWCPVPKPVDKGKGNETEISLGLLAGIWGDGAVRVVQIKYDKCRKGTAEGETTYLQLNKIFFQSKPPGTVCSCVTWLSSSDIAVGCANGYVAIWNLESAARSVLQPELEPNSDMDYRPWFYQPLHTTYISAIYSAYPSRPYLLTTTSMDGYVRLTDVRSPTTDHVLSFRTRLGVYSLAWVDAAQAFYAPDETSLVRAFPLRQFYSCLALCRASASVTALAASPVHPFLLVTSTDGAVTAANSLPRIYEGRNPVWQVVWMQHEWRPSLDEMRRKRQGGDKRNAVKNSFWKKLMSDGKDTQDNEMDIERGVEQSDIATAAAASATASEALVGDVDDGSPASGNSVVPVDKPLGRVVVGFVPTRAGKKQLRDDEEGKSENPSYTPLLVIHETRTAATAAAWNPNLSCGGWAAAGFASGLIRVEDLAV